MSHVIAHPKPVLVRVCQNRQAGTFPGIHRPPRSLGWIPTWISPRRFRKGSRMDDTRFDKLLRSLSSGASRRGALGLLLGGPLALLGLAETEAKKGKKGKGKDKGKGKGKPPPPPPPFCPGRPGGTVCGSDSRGNCVCSASGSERCLSNRAASTAMACDLCPPGTAECAPVGPFTVFCIKACGAP